MENEEGREKSESEKERVGRCRGLGGLAAVDFLFCGGFPSLSLPPQRLRRLPSMNQSFSRREQTNKQTIHYAGQ